MATTEIGNGSVSRTRIWALASELRLLKAGMADMQGRLDALLIEIGAELQHGLAVCEPSVDALPDRQDGAQPQAAAEIASGSDFAEALPQLDASSPAQAEIEPAVVAEMGLPAPADAVEEQAVAALQIALVEGVEPAAQIETIELTETVVATDALTLAPIATTAESVGIEMADVGAPAEPVADTPAAAAEMAAEPVTLADLPAEPLAETQAGTLAIQTQVAETPAAAAEVPCNVIVLAECHTAPRKRRSAIARAGRWAAVIALIAIVAAAAATGTGFAGHGEVLTVRDICALAGESCSIMLGIP